MSDVSSAQKDLYVLWGVIGSGDKNNNNILIESSCIVGLDTYPIKGDDIVDYLSSRVCPNGCSNGACISSGNANTCTDEDGGIDY